MSISGKTSKQRVQAGDFALLKIPRALTLNPDGTLLAYLLGRCEFERNKYFANLHVLDTRSGESRPWTNGDCTDRSPVWSRDGKKLAFLRFENGQDGIYILSLNGGEPHRVFAAKGFFGSIQWAIDDQSIIGMFLKADEKPAKDSVAVRKITRLSYAMEGMGFLPQERRQLYKLDLKTLEFTALTKGRADVGAWGLAPDGVTAGFVMNVGRDPDLDQMHTGIFLLNIRTGKKRALKLPYGEKDALAFSPNGKYLVYLGHNNPEDAWGVERVHPHLVDLRTGKLRDLTPQYDRMASDLTIGDTGLSMGAAQILWSADSRHVYYPVTDEGDTILVRAGLKPGDPEKVWSEHGVVSAISGNGKQLALTHASFDRFGDIHICDDAKSPDIEFRKLAAFNHEYTATRTFGKTKEVRFKSADGTRLHGFLITPPDFSPRKKHPTILEIHGGPRCQYGRIFFHEMQYLAAQGFVVFYTNPRGSQGYGRDFAGSTIAAWGTVDYEDIIAAADYLEGLSFVDKKHIGITGGSYGGCMTQFAIGHTNRFYAAVEDRGATNWVTLQATAFIGWHLKSEFKGYYWENPKAYEHFSPINYAAKIRTPLLIMTGDADLACPVDQPLQMYTALKLMNKCPVELWRFPEEGHGMSRGGRPDRRMIRLEGITAWFKKWLK